MTCTSDDFGVDHSRLIHQMRCAPTEFPSLFHFFMSNQVSSYYYNSTIRLFIQVDSKIKQHAFICKKNFKYEKIEKVYEKFRTIYFIKLGRLIPSNSQKSHSILK
jgi:hypothetical protein